MIVASIRRARGANYIFLISAAMFVSRCIFVKPIFESCCGLDVHRDQVTACIASGLPNEPEEKLIVKEFSSMTYGLKELSSWLKEHNVEFVAMESTGIFWKPVFNILEDDFEVILANAAHIKNVPGLKTDKKDARWIARLLRYGLVPASFIPPRNIRNLRDLTRTRKKLIEDLTRRKNRIHKVLQDANIKLSSVATNIFGVSGEAMIMALLEKDELSPEDIKYLAKGKLRNKIDLLIKAMDSTITDHHRFLLRMHFEQIGSISNQIAKFDEVIDRKLEPCKEEYELIQTCPGLNKITSASILAEIGVDISQFPDKHHLCSWAAICPGNNESAGKRKSGRTRHGNNYLKTTLVEAAWAASRTKDTYLSAKFHNIAKRRGNKKAAVATGHKILESVYHILSKRETYKEIGPEAARSQKSRASEYSMILKLEKAGYNIQKVEVPT
jgi:transposase